MATDQLQTGHVSQVISPLVHLIHLDMQLSMAAATL